MIKSSIILTSFFCLICFFCFTTKTYAAPAVNKVSGDTTLTIIGSNFSQHPDYSPSNGKTLARGWNNFESGSILTDDWRYGLGGAYKENWTVVSNSINRPGSKYFAARNYINSRLGGLELTQNFDANEWYWTFYIQISDTCPTSGGQGKISRIYGDNGNEYFSPYGSSSGVLSYFESIGGAQWGSPDGLGTNSWHRVEIFMSQSPQNVTVWIDGKKQWTRNDWPASNFNGGSHTWDIGNMIESVQKTCYHRFDDVYFDHTRARVEIGNSARWDNVSVREIQIPLEWTSSTIKVQANYGSFKTGDIAYLYIIDSYGNVSNNGQGLQVTIGDGGGSNTDLPPSNVSLPPPANFQIKQ